MKYLIPTLVLFLCLIDVFGQNSEITYLNHGHKYDHIYSYQVTEIRIHSDSTYTRKNWIVPSKKEWKTYKQYQAETSVGKIKQRGKHYVLTEYRNGNKTDFNWTVKLTGKRLIFYYPTNNKRFIVASKYKRI